MPAYDTTWPRTRLSRATSSLLVALLVSSTFLFVFTYQKYFISRLNLELDLSHGFTSYPREVTIELYPENHTRRPTRTVTHAWNITKGYRSPDGVHKLVYLINGQFPGPTIEVRSGDTLVVAISNQLDDEEGVSFHWHGLHMKGANEMDGVVGVTQNAIPVGETFVYKFKTSDTQAGTFWYHSHSELQRSDGLFGGLIIHKPVKDGVAESARYNYDKEQLLLIGDWYHRSAVDVQASYLTFRSSGHEPVPDSLLINGLGAFNCSMAVLSRPVDCKDVQTPRLVVGTKRTRLRVVNVGALAGLNMSIPNGEMEVIQIDGGNEIATSTAKDSIGILYPGERMDIVTSNHQVTTLSITLDPENFVFQNQALTATQSFPIVSSNWGFRSLIHPQSRTSDSQETTGFDLSTVLGPPLANGSMPVASNQTILVYTHLEMLSHFDHVPMGYMNRTNWIPQSKPLLRIPKSEWDEHQFMAEIRGNGEWVDIVVNNLDDKGHPFHLHGHDFYVLTRQAFPRRAGYRTYNPFQPPERPSSTATLLLYPEPNLVDPPLKDTVHIPRRGYVILRIRADNVGIWFFHCHILWHQGTGMAMGFVVSGDLDRTN